MHPKMFLHCVMEGLGILSSGYFCHNSKTVYRGLFLNFIHLGKALLFALITGTQSHSSLIITN